MAHHDLNIHLRLDAHPAVLASVNAAATHLTALLQGAGATNRVDFGLGDGPASTSTHVPHLTLLLGGFKAASAGGAAEAVVAALTTRVGGRCRPVRVDLGGGKLRAASTYAFWDAANGPSAELASGGLPTPARVLNGGAAPAISGRKCSQPR